jgi:glycosyltransferase 2 family protein
VNPPQRDGSDRPALVRTVLGWTKALFTPVAFAFLAYFAWQGRDVLVTVVGEASLPLLGLAAIVWSLLHLLSPMLAVFVLGACGSDVTWWRAFSIHAARLPARYAPGGIWHTVGRVMDYHRRGVQPRHLAAFVLLENGLAAAVTLAVGGAVVFVTRGADTLGVIAALSSLGGVVALPIIRIVLNARILRRPDHLSLSAYASGIGVVAIFWVGAAIAFLLYLNAFPSSTEGRSQVEMGGIYLFSWGVGFLSIFAPQGLGVFEVVAGELLKGNIGFMELAALMGGFRVVILVADLVVWCAYQALRPWFEGEPDTATR